MKMASSNVAEDHPPTLQLSASIMLVFLSEGFGIVYNYIISTLNTVKICPAIL
jgi:hypothetical protein